MTVPRVERALDFLYSEWRRYQGEKIPTWGDRAVFLHRLVAASDEPAAGDLNNAQALASFLQSCWNIPVIRLDEHGLKPRLGELHQTIETVGQLGRFCIRRFSLFEEGSGYLVLANHAPKMALWIVLHELGHIACHSPTFRHIGQLYAAICRDPAMEEQYCHQMRDLVSESVTEEQADEFACRWLLHFRRKAASESLLNEFGLAYFLMSTAFDDATFRLESSADAAELNNRGNEYGRSVLSQCYSVASDPDERAWWTLLRLIRAGSSIDPVNHRPESQDSAPCFLPRLTPEEARENLWYELWDPVIVTSREVRCKYYMPIRPRPTRRYSDDRTSNWEYMTKNPLRGSSERTIRDWIDLHLSKPVAGLMLFPRTPAERALDAAGYLRPESDF